VLYRLPQNNINLRKEIEVMKKLIFLLLPFLLLVTSVLAQCVTPYENIEINTSTTFCAGTYYLNDSDMNGVINITGDNLILDCNGSLIIGSNISSSIGLRIHGRNNITIKNCVFKHYWTLLDIKDSSLKCYNSSFVGSRIDNTEGVGIRDSSYVSIIGDNCIIRDVYWSYIGHANNTYISNLTFQDNTFRDIFAHEEVRNLTIENSRFEGDTSDFHIALGTNDEEIVIKNNYIYGGQGFYIPDSSNVLLEGNEIISEGANLVMNSYNITLRNNTINRTSSDGAVLYLYIDVQNLTMRDNKLYSPIDYGLGIHLTSCLLYNTLDIDISNYLNDFPLYYLVGYSGSFNLPTNEVILANSKGFRVEGDIGTIITICSIGNLSVTSDGWGIVYDNSTIDMENSQLSGNYSLTSLGLIGHSVFRIYDSSLVSTIELNRLNVTLINSTEPSLIWDDTVSHLFRGWWLNLTIKPVSASVKITNQLDQIEFQGTVSKAKIPLTQYEKYYGGSNEVIVNYTPHTVSARALGYVPKEVSITMDNNKDLVIDLGVYRYSLVNPIFSIIVTLGITSLVGAWLYYTIKGIPIPKNLSDIVKIYFIFIAVTIVIILLSVLFQYL